MDYYKMDRKTKVVHNITCPEMADAENLQHLGFFLDCHDAMKKANELNPNTDNINGCKNCCRPCHTD